MSNIIYTRIPNIESEAGGKEACSQPSSHPPIWHNISRISAVQFAILLISLATNLVFVHKSLTPSCEMDYESPSKYAQLRRNVSTEILAHSDFDSTNRTIQDAAWGAPELEPWNNFVALDEDYTIAVGLPHSQRWPWDSSKGTYIITSAHELHCVHVLRVTINQNQDRVPPEEQTWHYGHLMHCLNLLRESVTCNADDTPLYTGHLHANANANASSAKAGIGSVKMCRDWNLLLEWSRARSACYRPVHWSDAEFPETERYKFCPDGQRPWE